MVLEWFLDRPPLEWIGAKPMGVLIDDPKPDFHLNRKTKPPLATHDRRAARKRQRQARKRG